MDDADIPDDLLEPEDFDDGSGDQVEHDMPTDFDDGSGANTL